MRKILVLTLLLGAAWVAFGRSPDLDSSYLGRQVRLRTDTINDRVGRSVDAPTKR